MSCQTAFPKICGYYLTDNTIKCFLCMFRSPDSFIQLYLVFMFKPYINDVYIHIRITN